MRSFATVAAASLFAAQALAAADGSVWGGYWGPWVQSTNNDGRDACMSDQDAQTVADHFDTLISAYTNSSAEAYLTTDFHDYSDGVIELIDSGCPNSPIPLGTATFTSRTAFEAGQGSQPNISFTQLNVWHNCQTVFLRWKTDLQPSPVTGIIVLETVKQGTSWLIQTVYSEFNSGAWLVDLGVFKPQNCSSGPPPQSSS